MNADIITSTTFPHGTPAGFTRGCRGAHCPAPIACRDVHRRYSGDFKFRRMFDSGSTLEQIVEHEKEAARAVLAAEKAARRAKVRPVQKPPRRPVVRVRQDGPHTPLQVDVHRLHAEGLVDKDIAEQLGKTREQIRSVRRWLNLPLNPTVTTIDRVRELHGHGLNDVEIAQKLGKEVEYVATLRRRAKLPLIPYQRTKLGADEVTRLHRQGFTDQQIADHFNVARRVAQKRRAYLKLTPNKPPTASGVSSFQGQT